MAGFQLAVQDKKTRGASLNNRAHMSWNYKEITIDCT